MNEQPNACEQSVFDGIISRITNYVSETEYTLNNTEDLLAKLTPRIPSVENKITGELKRSEPVTIIDKLSYIIERLEVNLRKAELNRSIILKLVG
jgi:hypothetical protein